VKARRFPFQGCAINREAEKYIFWRAWNHFDHKASGSVPQPSHRWTRDFLPPFDHSGINHFNSTGRWRA
jgi:hypothetical protein